MTAARKIVVKHYEPKDKYHGLSHDAEYETISTEDNLGLAAGAVPMTEQEKQYVESLPHIKTVYEDLEVTYPGDADVSSSKVDDVHRRFHNVDHVHEKGLKGKGVRVAIVDTGLDYTHSKNLNVHAARSFVGGDWKDRDGHSTHIVGCIADLDFGLAPECSLIIAKGLGDDGSGSLSGIMKACEWSASVGAKVINLSLSARIPKDNPLADMADALFKKGIVVVCAAGNDGCSSNTADYNTPANADLSISVAAVDLEGRVASFSSCGESVDIAAFGVNVPSYGLNGSKGKNLSGTSMAAPSVSGIAALFANDYSASEIKKALISNARDTPSPASKEGAGIADALKMYMKLAGSSEVPEKELPVLSTWDFYRNEGWKQDAIITRRIQGKMKRVGEFKSYE